MTIKSIKTGWTGISAAAGNNLLPATGYSLWLDAADTSTISVSTNAVTQWTDKSSNAYAFTQGTAANRPSSGTRTLNGRNVIDFDGSNDFLASTATASTWNFLHNTSGSTWFAVIVPDSTAATQVVFETNGGFGDQNGVWYLITTGANHNWRVTSSASVADLTDSVTTGSGVLYAIKSDPGNATASNRMKYYKNSGAATGTNTATGTASSGNAYETMKISYSTLAFDGALAEILLYPSLLSDVDRERTRDYLVTKWGL